MQAARVLDCAWLVADPGSAPARQNMRLSLQQGRIAAIAPLDAAVAGRRRLVLPALVNAHDHARTFRSATLGAFGQPLESWLPYLGVIPGADPYLCAATSFARTVRGGVSDAMVHYTRVQGLIPYLEEARAVARAACDVGLRIGFAIAMRDRNGLGYCEDAAMLSALRPGIREEVAARLSVKPVSAQQQLAQVDAVARMVTEGGHGTHVTVQYGPTGVQWCSTPLLEAVAAASADTGRSVHMHLLETRYQRDWADHEHPQGIVPFLDRIGLLSPRLTLAHCTWARPQELALLAARGVTIAVNTSSNLGLKSGIAPVAEMLRQGCRIAMGLDGMAFDEDDDALREMRLAFSLHRGWGYETEMSRAQLWAFAAVHGRRSVNGGGAPGHPAAGRVAVGADADLLVLDWDAVDDDALLPGIDPLDLVLARASGAHVDQLFVGGRAVVEGGQVVTVDERALRTELIAQVRAGLAARGDSGQWQRTVDSLAEDLGPFYRGAHHRGCC